MKIYTKQGDKGTTSLWGGTSVSKSDLRMEAVGDVDELNALLGLCLSECENENIKTDLLHIQQILFSIGAVVAVDKTKVKQEQIPSIAEQQLIWLETNIDKMDLTIPALTNFILPGGNRLIALLHVARAICRRAERHIVALHENNLLNNNTVITYLNRLSDYLFTLTRFVAYKENIAETIWKP